MIGDEVIDCFLKTLTRLWKILLNRLSSKEELKQHPELPKSEQFDELKKQYQTAQTSATRWEKDYRLLDYEKEGGTFNENLKLAMQYGFVVLFAPAFPLAPLLAWMKNVFSITFDAKQILKIYRRQVPVLNPNIKLWLKIFNYMGHIAVLINAIVIVFSPNIFPGYNNITDVACPVNISNQNWRSMLESVVNGTSCYYLNDQGLYSIKGCYKINISAEKLTFIILYQNIILVLKTLILKWIPETPKRLHRHQKKERGYILDAVELLDLADRQLHHD